ncbi:MULTISPECIES: IS3 family transposase [unclassified Anoxybacillus]|uniref:IS3 family transposase n=1 Tax=unclassified Anoxybacillus TaxID=2639704 RepID=UPI0009E335A9|nr:MULTISPECIES: IS3 family transposase [unclassified Anoxybacillus]
MAETTNECPETKKTDDGKRIHIESRPLYGSPKITKMLQQEGIPISQKTVARWMKEEGIRSKTKKKHKPASSSPHQLPNLSQPAGTTVSCRKAQSNMGADITYIWTAEGWLYLASIMDLFSRRMVGWAISERMNRQLGMRALERAVQKRQPPLGLIHHSDQGSQYASHDYQAMLRKYGMKTSMSRKGNCYDNACIESFHGVIKKERIYQTRYKTREEAKKSIFEYIEIFYNNKRIHSATEYFSPSEYERMDYKKGA